MSENNVNQEAKDQPFEATTYGGLLRIARENKELSIDQVSSQLRISPDQIVLGHFSRLLLLLPGSLKSL